MPNTQDHARTVIQPGKETTLACLGEDFWAFYRIKNISSEASVVKLQGASTLQLNEGQTVDLWTGDGLLTASNEGAGVATLEFYILELRSE